MRLTLAWTRAKGPYSFVVVSWVVASSSPSLPVCSPTGGYGESSMVGGYTQSPGGFASPTLSQGGEKKGVCTEVYTTVPL